MYKSLSDQKGIKKHWLQTVKKYKNAKLQNDTNTSNMVIIVLHKIKKNIS